MAFNHHLFHDTTFIIPLLLLIASQFNFFHSSFHLTSSLLFFFRIQQPATFPLYFPHYLLYPSVYCCPLSTNQCTHLSSSHSISILYLSLSLSICFSLTLFHSFSLFPSFSPSLFPLSFLFLPLFFVPLTLSLLLTFSQAMMERVPESWPTAPTHFSTNKYTYAFQEFVNTYGIPR